MDIKIRSAQKSDMQTVHDFIMELAIYEKAKHEMTVTVEELERDGFGEHPKFEVILACNKDEVLGIAFFYEVYSTWKGPCLYLEDFVVKEAYRQHGIGKMLFDEVAKTAAKRNMQRMRWQVLDWNEPAINFYKKIGAEIDEGWYNGTLRAEHLKNWLD